MAGATSVASLPGMAVAVACLEKLSVMTRM
jgi:hypothetical protein